MKASMRKEAMGSAFRKIALFVYCSVAGAMAANGQTMAELEAARDRGDIGNMEQLIAKASGAANSPESEYKLALAYSYGAEIAMEQRDKKKSEALAEKGLDPAAKAVAGNNANAEYHRLQGALCGQVIPANPLMGALKYGQCARDQIDKAIQLNPNLALAYVTRGVGNFYLPAAMGGGVDVALKDFDKAVSLNPKLSDAYLWKGVTLRKAGRIADARQALEQASKLAPNRVWIKEQLQKLPPQ
ncbi:MAG: tetratricopeptide repeat protein [Bryobacteraceae bacterium]